MVVPTESLSVQQGVCLLYRKEVREGRIAAYADSRLPSDGQTFSFDALSHMCAAWRANGIFSFIEVQMSGPGGSEELLSLHRVKQIADWLILDTTSEMNPHLFQSEQWNEQALFIKRIGKKVGLKLTLDQRLPVHVIAPWIAKIALELKAPCFLFLEGDCAETTIEAVRIVQDILANHALSKDSARLIPVLRSTSHSIGEKSVEVLDFSSLDLLLIESGLPFFGGVSIRQESIDTLFGLSLWQVIARMICEKRSCISVLEHSAEGVKSFPDEWRRPFVKSVYELLLKNSLSDQVKILQAKNELEALVGKICRESVCAQESMIAPTILALIEQAKEMVGKNSGNQKPSMIGSFFRSMNV